MEHLFFTADKQSIINRVTAASLSEILEDDWTNLKYDWRKMPHVHPTTKWLGFDHDPPFRNAERPPVQANVNGYPSIRGWTVERAWDRGDLCKVHPSFQLEEIDASVIGQRFAAMLQSWLYFGFLEAITGKFIETSYLVRPDGAGNALLYSQNLAFALQAWVEVTRRKAPAEREAELERADENMIAVATVIQQLLCWTDSGSKEADWMESHYPGFCQSVVELTPAVLRLLDAVGVSRERVVADDDLRIISINGLRDALDVRNSRLLERGWCPFLLKSCEESLRVSVLDWLDGSGKQSPLGGHELCTERSCVRNNVDTSTYRMQHVDNGCHCSPVKPHLETVTSAIDQGQIPIIRISRSSESVELEVSSCSANVQGDYIAISHVWVDGLGSTTEEGMLECQVKRLGTLIGNLTNDFSVSLWIDSLCVPSLSKHRRKSIGLLRNVYRNASKVLVVDKMIRQCSADTSAEELAWSIISSPWMQRLWTYQESYLANNVVFELSGDSFLDIADFPFSTLPDSVQVVVSSLMPNVRILRPDLGLHGDRRTNIGEVSSALNWRTTSKMEDEVLAIAALLNVSSEALAVTDPKQRMQHFYLMVRNMPHDIIFFDAPKMQEPPFRWAPKSFMARAEITSDTTPEGQRAVCTEAGLHCKYLTLQLHQEQKGEDGLVWWILEDSEREWYTIYWDPTLMNYSSSSFNAIIIRAIQGEGYLVPDLNAVREGIAVLTLTEKGEYLTCEYAGRVTLLKYSAEDKESHCPSGSQTFTAEWQKRNLCIT